MKDSKTKEEKDDLLALLRKPDHEQALEWLLGFQDRNLEVLSADDMTTLRNEVETFCRSSAVFNFSSHWAGYPVWASEQLHRLMRQLKVSRNFLNEYRSIHRTIRDGLETLFPRQLEADTFVIWQVPLKLGKPRLTYFQSPSIARLRPKTIPRHKWRTPEANLSYTVHTWQDVFWAWTIDLLKTHIPRIKRCTGCQRCFLKKGKQEYCSSRCSLRVRSRRWYRQNPEKAREIRHESYRRHRQKQHPDQRLKNRRNQRPPRR